MSFAIGKRAAALRAVEFVKPGMLLGLGTGSTAAYFIEAVGARVREGLDIKGVASSKETRALAMEAAIPLLDDDAFTALDLTVDGADQIDSKKRLIKGGGGALTREKIVASASTEMLVIADSSKVVKALGPIVPIEVLHFGLGATQKHVEALGAKVAIRQKGGRTFKTDNGNLILDLDFGGVISDPEGVEAKLCKIPGIVETGFFFHLATRVIVGYPDETCEVL